MSPETKQRFPDLPWARPARLRNRIVHGYWSVDVELLHATAVNQLPSFVSRLRTALAELENDPDATDAKPDALD